MSDLIGPAVDLVLIIVVGIGTVQAIRLIRQLQDLHAGRSEMDRFVRDFNSAVMRAEVGIKSLRAAARESGDDLEKLVEKGVMVRDELSFIVESADSVAERLSAATSTVLHTEQAPTSKPQANAPEIKSSKPVEQPQASRAPETAPPSRAEKELLQALKKLS